MKKILLLTDFSSGYSRSLLRGIVHYAREHEPWVFFRMPQYYRALHGDDGVTKWAERWQADAVIAQLEQISFDKLETLNIPVIIQNCRNRAERMCNITGDYRATGVMAADFFLSRGFTNFGFYGYSHMIWSRERADGFRNRIEAAGFRTSVFNVRNRKSGQWSFDAEAVSSWLRSLPRPTAIFACDDQFASQITEICKLGGIAVPQEVSVLGVDNDELICSISDPPLSSIALDVEQGGYNAAASLHQMLHGESRKAIDIVIPPLRIEERKSTERYATDDALVLQTIDFIRNNLTRPICVDDLLRNVPISRRVFERRFMQEMNITAYKFILHCKMEELASRLATTDCPLNELAQDLGFGDYSNIARVFRRYYGTTPLQYRIINQKQNATQPR